REQGGQVVAEVIGGRAGKLRSVQPSPPEPAAERQPGWHGPWLASGVAKAEDLGVHRVPDQVLARVGLGRAAVSTGFRWPGRLGALRCPGAVRIEPGPDELTGAFPAGRLALAQRRVRERGDKHRTKGVHKSPPELVSGGAAIVEAGVEADLHR